MYHISNTQRTFASPSAPPGQTRVTAAEVLFSYIIQLDIPGQRVAAPRAITRVWPAQTRCVRSGAARGTDARRLSSKGAAALLVCERGKKLLT